ncbi:MAG: CPBP family intramembrane glutamic endopeptidase [Chloroflexia bacterium]
MESAGPPEGQRVPLWNWRQVLGMSASSLGILLAGSLGVAWGMRAAQAAGWARGPMLLLGTMAIVFLEVAGLLGSVYFLGLRRRGLSWRALGLVFPRLEWLIAALVIGFGGIFLTSAVAGLVQRLMGRTTDPQTETLAPIGFSWAAGFGMFLLVGLGVPFAEEVFFRGVLFRWLRERWGVHVGLLVSTLIFGLVHGDPPTIAAGWTLGLILGLVYEHSHSLWTPILIHALNNSAKVILLYLLLALR